MKRENGILFLPGKLSLAQKYASKIQIKLNGEDCYIKNIISIEDIDEVEENFIELIIERIAREVNINCPYPEIVQIGKYRGILTKSYLDATVKRVTGKQILKEYSKISKIKITKEDAENHYANFNNLKDIGDALHYHFRNYESAKRQEIVSKIMLELNRRYIFDYIIMQGDRCSLNWEILEKKDQSDAYLAPLFDNEYAFSLYTFKPYCLNPSLKSENNSSYEDDLINYLKTSSSYFINEFMSMFLFLTPKKIEELIKSVEEERNMTLPRYFKEQLLKDYKENYECIKEKLIHLNLMERSQNYGR